MSYSLASQIILTDILLVACIFPCPCGAQKNATQVVKYPHILICFICSSFTERDPECAECKKADEAIEKAQEK